MSRISKLLDKIYENGLPPRTADTMSTAISMSSPSGRVSGRARKAAVARLGRELFGPEGLQGPTTPQPSEHESLLRQAKELRDLAARGMKPRAYTKHAAELEARAHALMSKP